LVFDVIIIEMAEDK
jgi:hypothetical protein